MSKYSKKAIAARVNSVRPYKSRTQRPCDFCRRRKTCCIIQKSTPCLACTQFNNGECTFVEKPLKRAKKSESPPTRPLAVWRRSAPPSAGPNPRPKPESLLDLMFEPSLEYISGTQPGSTSWTNLGSTSGTQSGSTSGTQSGSTSWSQLGSTSGIQSGSTSWSQLGSTSGTQSESTSGIQSGPTSGTQSGSTSGTQSGPTSWSQLGSTSQSRPQSRPKSRATSDSMPTSMRTTLGAVPVAPSPQSASADSVMSYPSATNGTPSYSATSGFFDYPESLGPGHSFYKTMQLPPYTVLSGHYPHAAICNGDTKPSQANEGNKSAAQGYGLSTPGYEFSGHSNDPTTAVHVDVNDATDVADAVTPAPMAASADHIAGSSDDSLSELSHSRLMSVVSMSTLTTSRHPSVNSSGSMPTSASVGGALDHHPPLDSVPPQISLLSAFSLCPLPGPSHLRIAPYSLLPYDQASPAEVSPMHMHGENHGPEGFGPQVPAHAREYA